MWYSAITVQGDKDKYCYWEVGCFCNVPTNVEVALEQGKGGYWKSFEVHAKKS